MTTFTEYKYESTNRAFFDLIGKGYVPNGKNEFVFKSKHELTFADLFFDGTVLFTRTTLH